MGEISKRIADTITFEHLRVSECLVNFASLLDKASNLFLEDSKTFLEIASVVLTGLSFFRQPANN